MRILVYIGCKNENFEVGYANYGATHGMECVRMPKGCENGNSKVGCANYGWNHGG